MIAHLCDEKIGRLLSGTLPADEVVQAEAHLWQCLDCRDALRRRTEPTPDLPPLAAPRSEGAAPLNTLPAVPGYEILGELGRGGMAVVYQARQLRPNRVVALKVLQTGLPADARRRFGVESEALARLQHPGIVQVYEAGEHDGRSYFSLEFCGGGSLARKLAGAPMEPLQAAALVEAVARAVGVAHRAGIVHRDLKPANILLQTVGGSLPVDKPVQGHVPSAIPKVSDFGLAKLLTSDASEPARSGAVLGTPSYMAPEQLDGAAGSTADVYALGAILYECLTGRPPFHAVTVFETLELVRSREPVPPRQLRPGIASDLETVCLKCLEKEPARRYATAEGLADDLRRFCEGRPVVARPVSRPERLRRWARRNPLPATLAAILALAVTAGLATALALWWKAERHLREEEIARREAEDHYLACRRLLGEYVAVTHDPQAPGFPSGWPRLHNPAAQRERREALAKARAFCEELALRHPDDPSLPRVLAEVCTGLAALDAHEGRLDDARQVGETARTLWQEVAAAAPDADCRERLAGVLSSLGFVYGRLGRNVEAAASLQQALVLWDQLGGDGTNPSASLLAACTARRELAGRHWALGSDVEELQLYAENCSRLERATSGGGGPPELRLELLVNLRELGRMCDQAGNRVDAVRHWRRGYELGRRLIDEMPDSSAAAYHLALCGNELAARDRAAAPPEETARLCGQAARLLEAQRLRDPADRDCTRALARVCAKLADSSIQAGQRAEALRAARRAAAVLAELADRHPDDPAARLQMLQGQAGLAVREARCGESSAARHSARQAADGLEVFCDSWSADPHSLASAVRIGADIAPALRHAGVPDQVMRVVQCCLRTAERLVREYPNEPDYQALLSGTWNQAGKANWSERRYEQAEAALRAAVQVADRLAERWPEYRPMREDRVRRLGRFLEERSEAAAVAARERAKE